MILRPKAIIGDGGCSIGKDRYETAKIPEKHGIDGSGSGHGFPVFPCDAKKRPNVIVILTDDQGYGDFSCHGNPVLKTPNMDKLAAGGVHFSDFHCSPVCTPTRGQLMTGLDALHNLACCVTSGRTLMRRDIPTMADHFRKGGYATGLFGKWHLGHAYPDRPMDRGFDKVRLVQRLGPAIGN